MKLRAVVQGWQDSAPAEGWVSPDTHMVRAAQGQLPPHTLNSLAKALWEAVMEFTGVLG